MKFNKSLITLLMSSAVLAGCSSMGNDESVTPAVLKAEYDAVASQEVQLSQIGQLSQVAATTNALFQESYPIYQDYAAHVENSNGIGATHSAAVAMLETDEERKAYIEDLKANNADEYQQYQDFINDEQLMSIYGRVGKAALQAVAQSALLAKLDTGALITGSGLGFMDIGREKDVVALMADQISVMNKTIVALNDEYEANKAANAIK
ncbi:hypothetical protein [Vibrio europaeus]|uniref:hypothetical protein n=1 Tax=Vibrio europaeus TaxID=300876 RepID=UPI00148DF514|nr:hypothetical protein [Vibrio europaeus]MDC5839393.1 hypothetical protein [Vibrio europaeus]NOH23665.1 hypothetical protein [Vibrio europaeus]